MSYKHTGTETYTPIPAEQKGLGPNSAGQAGDTQGLSEVAESASQSVAELAEEGQFFEAEVISGIEDAPSGDAAELRTREVLEDDVPAEYLDVEHDSDSNNR